MDSVYMGERAGGGEVGAGGEPNFSYS